MPNRLLRDGFVDSDRVNALDYDQECFYHRLLLVCDDAGRFDGREDILKSRLFPLGFPEHSDPVKRGLEGTLKHDLVRIWTVDGKPILQVMRWQKCGKSTVSKWPGPDGTYEFSYIERQTPSGKKLYVTTSTPDPAPIPPRSLPHSDPIGTPCLPHAYPMPTPCLPHAYPMPTPSAPHSDGVKSSQNVTLRPHRHPMPTPCLPHADGVTTQNRRSQYGDGDGDGDVPPNPPSGGGVGTSLPSAVEEGVFRVLHAEPNLARMNPRHVRAAVADRSPHMDFVRAAQFVAGKARLEDSPVRKPASFLSAWFRIYEGDNAAETSRRRKQAMERERALNQFAQFVAEGGFCEESVERQTEDHRRMWGDAFIDEAMEVAAGIQRGECLAEATA